MTTRPLERLLATALLALAPAAARAGFVASPMELHYDVGAGTEGSLPLMISNKADAPLTVRMALVDTRFGPDGVEENVDPGTLERSCAPWVGMGENVIDLAPREIRRVVVTLNVPADARGSYWTKMFIEEISSPQVTSTVRGDRTYNIFMKERLGIRIYEDVPGTIAPDLTITNVALAGDSDPRSPSVVVDVSNVGNSILRCSGDLELRDPQGGVAQKIPLGSLGRFVIFPDGKRRLAVRPPEPLEPGTYTALAIIDFGGDHLVAGDMLLDVPAPVVVRSDRPAGGS
jgi:hypothetical protein